MLPPGILRGSFGSCLLEGKNLVKRQIQLEQKSMYQSKATKRLEGAAPGFSVAEANDGFMNIYEVGGIFME